MDAEVTVRIAKDSAAFGRLDNKLLSDKAIKLSAKIATYRAVVLSTLFYCCWSWTTYRHHIRQLGQFHQRCLRKILHIKCQARVTNLETWRSVGCPALESLLIQHQLR